jgi:hypothetical protein
MVVHPFGFVASGGPAWRPGPTCHVTDATVTTCKETASPLAPMPRLLDCRTSATTRGSPTRDPTMPIECNDHGSVSRGDRRDGRYGQKRTDSNCSNRRAEVAVQSPTGSHPLPKRQGSPLPWSKDDASMFRSSNDSRTRNRRPANRLSRRINSLAGQATPPAGEAGAVSPPSWWPRQKRCATLFKFISFSFSSLSLSLATGIRKGDIPKGSFSAKEVGPEPSY